MLGYRKLGGVEGQSGGDLSFNISVIKDITGESVMSLENRTMCGSWVPGLPSTIMMYAAV